jgi:hypothetical protein
MATMVSSKFIIHKKRIVEGRKKLLKSQQSGYPEVDGERHRARKGLCYLEKLLTIDFPTLLVVLFLQDLNHTSSKRGDFARQQSMFLEKLVTTRMS